MSVRRPDYKASAKATREATEQDSLFVKVPPGGSVQVRFLPPDNPEGALFYKAVNHFNFRDPAEPSRGVAWACLDEHGSKGAGKCPACQVVRFVLKHGTDAQKALVKRGGASSKTINAGTSFYAQVYLRGRESKGVKLLRVPPTGADAVAYILGAQNDNGLPLLSDSAEGEWIIVSKVGAGGLDTEWKAMSTSVRVPLDRVDPEWATHVESTRELLNLKIISRADMIQSLRNDYGKVLPLEEIFTAEELAGVA